jgi:hypothetical protein
VEIYLKNYHHPQTPPLGGVFDDSDKKKTGPTRADEIYLGNGTSIDVLPAALPLWWRGRSNKRMDGDAEGEGEAGEGGKK